MPDDIRRELLAEEARRTERARTMREKAAHCGGGTRVFCLRLALFAARAL